ncbi:MAG: hypothetical protein IKH67_07335 [Lachnospiraceae bacterium]|nr:hypothetical protein [Lachnospiraceae bacterium]MBR6349828.1 hypothetical protein [Lachnospiraceae bacterium]
MYQQVLEDLLKNKKNFVFIGEAGSGKTEISLSLAVYMTKLTDKEVHLFDMDQTKPNFRARDVAKKMEEQGVSLHYHEQILDTPNVVPGVKEHLKNPDAYILMDIGGGAYGSHMIGQFHNELNTEDSIVFYIINPYRPWSRNLEDIQITMQKVLGSARLRSFSIVGNPNLGMHTTVEDVVEGMDKLHEYCGDTPIQFVCVLEENCAEVEKLISEPVVPIKLHTLPDWMYKS